MSVRMAELAMAVLMLAASVGIMIKSTELNIGWIPGRGPGGGAWPFWLGAGMALCCVATIVRWALRITPESRSPEPFIARDTLFIVLLTLGALLALLLLTEIVGMYFALMAFLLFYLRFAGRHSWYLSASFTVGVPVFVFCLFEWALTTSLPKGLDLFEPLYYPLYEIIYSPGGWQTGLLIMAWIGLAIAIGGIAQRGWGGGLLTLFAGLVFSPLAGLAWHLTQRRGSGSASGTDEA